MSAAILPYIYYGLAALTAVGTYASAKAQAQAGADEQAGYDLQANAIERKGAQDEKNSRSRLRRLLASQRALYAKAGVDISSGSPLTVMADTAAEGEKEALNIRFGAKEEAGFRRFYGKQANAAGRRAAGASLLTGLGSTGMQIVSTYSSFSKSNTSKSTAKKN